MEYTLYEVGGRIRDELLGLKSKDIDYSVVIKNPGDYKDVQTAFKVFVEDIKEKGYEVFLETEDCFTVRAKFPKGSIHEGLVADFVLARKELDYIKGTRKPNVVLGTLRDDLERRDFTVNTLAKEENGTIIDLFGGQKDLMNRILRTPSDTAISFNNDPLRILRGMRFAITKDMDWSDEMWRVFDNFDARKLKVVSLERKREELLKCFKHDTHKTLQFLKTMELYNSEVYFEILPKELWLEPTNKK